MNEVQEVQVMTSVLFCIGNVVIQLERLFVVEENKKDNDSNNESNIVKHSESYRHHEISLPYMNDGIVDVPMHNVDLVNFSTSQQEKDDNAQCGVYDISVLDY